MKKLLPTLRLSLDMTNVLAKIEHAGIKVNLETLNDIRNEYEHELTTIDKRLKQIVSDVMGDTPINLNSADDRSMLFYSRKINNKETWTRIFNIIRVIRHIRTIIFITTRFGIKFWFINVWFNF